MDPVNAATSLPGSRSSKKGRATIDDGVLRGPARHAAEPPRQGEVLAEAAPGDRLEALGAADTWRDRSPAFQQQRCYYGCMVAITVRNVPEEVRDELAARAARSGRSLQEYLLHELLDMAARPAAEDIIAQARSRVRSTGTVLRPEDILAARNADRK